MPRVIVTCDFFVVVTATFRTLYVFVIMDQGTRRILHHNVTAHATAEWTLQQFREALPGEHPYRLVIHDRDSIFGRELDEEATAMGVRVLKTPVRAPKANSVCERFGGTMRCECLDFLVPFNERHLRLVLKMWIAHFNQSRPHMSLGPGIPAACVRHRRRALIATVFLRATRWRSRRASPPILARETRCVAVCTFYGSHLNPLNEVSVAPGLAKASPRVLG